MIDAGDGNDFVNVSGTIDATILGGAGDDYLIGSPLADFIDGGSGNDVLLGDAGDDTLYGGDGNDRVTLTFTMQPTTAIIMLSCIYWGALFGGAITSVLFNIPGEPWSVATTFDGYPMAQQGRAGEALTAAFTSSFVGAFVAVTLPVKPETRTPDIVTAKPLM